jgi:AraC-like DNA-binding protein
VVGNNESKSIVEINSKNNVDGICIDVSEKTIKEITHYHFENPKILEDFLFTEKFLVNKYNHKNTQLGGLIKKISKNVILEPTEKNFNKELFYEIAEKIILDQSQIFEQYDKLKFVKKTTNEVLYRQLYSAKELIDNSIEEKINIGSISQNIGLSEYHFIRLFKTVFGKTPYHYLIERRLNIAKEKIMNGENISEVALNFAYMDLQSFSKSFKKMFGKSPSQIIKNQ